MDRVLRLVLTLVIVLIALGFFVGIVAVGLSILFPLLIALAVLYGIFYLYQRSSFLQKIFKKSKKNQKRASGVTTYYELDAYGNQKDSKTIVEVYEDDKR